MADVGYLEDGGCGGLQRGAYGSMLPGAGGRGDVTRRMMGDGRVTDSKRCFWEAGVRQEGGGEGRMRAMDAPVDVVTRAPFRTVSAATDPPAGRERFGESFEGSTADGSLGVQVV